MHVTAGVKLTQESGYVETMPLSGETASHYSQPLALDCEMCYTTIGLQLTRVTVVDVDMKVVFESLVRPSKPIVDYNTRYVCGHGWLVMLNVTVLGSFNMLILLHKR